jgi:hypothetical protein
MLQMLRERIDRFGDRIVAQVAPAIDADAACGGFQRCCGLTANGVLYTGVYREDPEHYGSCTPCYLQWIGC